MVRAFAGELDKEKRGGHMSLEEERRRKRNHCFSQTNWIHVFFPNSRGRNYEGFGCI
jgi:hypothetical protein